MTCEECMVFYTTRIPQDCTNAEIFAVSKHFFECKKCSDFRDRDRAIGDIIGIPRMTAEEVLGKERLDRMLVDPESFGSVFQTEQ